MASTVRCRYAAITDFSVERPETAAHWLSAREREASAAMRSAERRATWLAGRVLAKRVLGELLHETGSQLREVPPDQIDISTVAIKGGLADRPRVSIDGRALDCALSIAHTEQGVLVALSAEAGVRLGVDLVARNDRRRDALAWCFTESERRWLSGTNEQRHGREQLWAMKEALYKAWQTGEGFAPRQIEVVPGTRPWYPAKDGSRAVSCLQCWHIDGQLAALAIVQ